LTFQNHTNRPLTDFGGKTSIFSHPVYLFLREFSLQDFRGGSNSEKYNKQITYCNDQKSTVARKAKSPAFQRGLMNLVRARNRKFLLLY
ncbi:hypothetical protein, partial [Escherichia coli]